MRIERYFMLMFHNLDVGFIRTHDTIVGLNPYDMTKKWYVIFPMINLPIITLRPSIGGDLCYGIVEYVVSQDIDHDY